jgi:hypothetical protein
LEEIREMKDMKNEQENQKLEKKRAKLNQIRKLYNDKVSSLEKKFQNKEQSIMNTKMAMDEFHS